MNPEELKIIAEGMGYETRVLGFGVNERIVLTAYTDDSGELIELLIEPDYKPDTSDDTQCMEIMEKLLLKYFALCRADKGVTFTNRIPIEAQPYKTINEAVCKAALEYFKDKEP